MKKLLSILLTLTVCSAALCVTAAAARSSDSAPRRVWGVVSPWDGDGIFLKNDDTNDSMSEVVLRIGEEVRAVDASTGLPLDLESVKEGDTLYAWIGPAATMSLPPQVFPEIIVGNVPEGAAVPEYYQITGAAVAGENGTTLFPVQNGGQLAVTEKTAYTPWRTRQIVRMEDLTPGTKVLVWRDGTAAEKVLVFAYDYRGYAAWDKTGASSVNGETVTVPGRVEKHPETGEELVYLPLRAVAEAAGYDVLWDKNRGAVVQDENVELVFYAVPGEEVIFQNGGETGISGPCILENGVTYLPAEDLCYWLNLFFTAD